MNEAAMDVEAEQLIAKAKPVLVKQAAEREKAAAIEERRERAEQIADMQKLAAAVHK